MSILSKMRYYFRLSKLRQNQGHRKVPRQLFEMAVLFILKGIGPGYYHAAKLWRNDYTWNDKFGWLSEKRYRKRVYQYNPRAYQKISQNKLAEKALLALLSIPTSDFLGYYHPTHGRNVEGDSFRSGKDVERLLRSRDVKRFCVKELEGWGGRGLRALKVLRNEEQLEVIEIQSGERSSIVDFFAQVRCPKEGLILEAYIEQHPKMKSLNPTSVNTLRIFATWQQGQAQPTVDGAFVRIGRAGSVVDNTSSGGLAAVIDPETGILASGHFKPPHPDEFSVHPDHGSPIEGVAIPSWEEAKRLVIKTMPLFPHIRYCGFDVAISTSGPLIVEMNVEPDKLGLAQVGTTIQELLPPE